jgi:iron complex outermembrane receptor protein
MKKDIHMRKKLSGLLILTFFIFNYTYAYAQTDLTKLNLDELMNIEVYSAAKKPERVFDTAAAIFVITPEDIHRSGATNIPELLRMVPGIRVEKINSHDWDVSIRGFNGSIYANKLLVLIDGRSVYSPLYAGVIWDLQDVVLEDIERIEVIRGPGGALWGANAVNGVINIITKKAKDTQGSLISVGGGTEERAFTTARYGGKSGDWFYRTYVKYFDREEGFSTTGNGVDDWDMTKAGFRAEKEKFTIQGDYYELNAGQLSTLTSFTPPYQQTFKDISRAKGGNLVSTYEDTDWQLKMYWDVTDVQAEPLGERRDQIDLEYTRQLHLTQMQDINWGLGYHLNLENMNNTVTETINRTSTTDQLFSLFVQDEIKAMDEKIKFTVGSKLEHNIYTGLEVEPNVRVLYHLTDKSQVWAAASRSVRTPSRFERNGQVVHFVRDIPLPIFERLIGNQDVTSEKMRAFELGYRNELNKNANFDLALFSDYYDQLIGFDYARIFFTVQNGDLFGTYPTGNVMRGEVHGLELTGDVRLKEWWKLKAYYSFTKMSLKMEPNFKVFGGIGLAKSLEELTPVNTSYLRSSFDLPHGFELDATFRYTSTFDFGSIPSVAELDINVSRNIKGWEVALVGQNLIESHHKESIIGDTLTQIGRSFYLKLTKRF